jgi:hypothetical protein
MVSQFQARLGEQAIAPAGIALRQAVPVVALLDLDADEKVLVQFEQIDARMTWKDTDRLFEIELSDERLALFAQMLDAKWPATRHHLAMLEKLNDALAGRQHE